MPVPTAATLVELDLLKVNVSVQLVFDFEVVDDDTAAALLPRGYGDPVPVPTGETADPVPVGYGAVVFHIGMVMVL